MNTGRHADRRAPPRGVAGEYMRYLIIQEALFFRRKENMKWISEDPTDRFWQLARIAIEEAKNRYGLFLYVNVEVNMGKMTAYFTSAHKTHTGGFSIPVTELVDTKATPDFYTGSLIVGLLRDFAEQRDMNNRMAERAANYPTAFERPKYVEHKYEPKEITELKDGSSL